MPQIVKKRRSGWAILAAGALIASLFAVGASPAAAITASSMADAASDRTACLGPATASADFEDVAMGGAHYKNIQCLAYYGITTGREGRTQFAPDASVTRSQMSLFLFRMADKAGLDLDDDSDAEFTDLDGIGADRVDAINRLVNAGIMTASGDDTFSPLAHVTRAEMALWLVSFMDNISDDVTLDPDTGDYTIEVNDVAIAEHDSFNDSLVSQPIHVHKAISVAFELGITTGYGDLEFKGHRNVSRAEMATFIMRTMAHTNLRPEGLTAQSSGTGTLSIQVSMRAAEFAPVDNKPIDVFGALFREAAFNDDGECVSRYVARVAGATRVCEIDAGDFLTGTDGNSEFTATAESVRPEQDTIMCGTGTGTYTVGSPIGDLANVEFWSWNGDYGDTVDDKTTLVKVVHVSPFSRTAGLEADHTSVTGGLDIMKNQHEAEMGDSVPYTVQLHGIDAENMHVDTGPPEDGAEYNVVISKFTVAYADVDHDSDAATPNVRLRTDVVDNDATNGRQAAKASAQPYLRIPSVQAVDSDGTLTIALTHPDPDRRKNGDDVIVEILITPVEDNELLIQEGLSYDSDGSGTVDAQDDNGFFDSVVFSDDGVDQTRIAVTAATTPGYRRAPATGRNANAFVSVTVIDQYGKPVRGQGVHAVSDAGTDSNASPDNTLRFQDWYVTGSNGSHTIGYSYGGGIGVENLSVINTRTPRTVVPDTGGDSGQRTPVASARLYWAVDGIQEDSPVAGYSAIDGTDAPAAGDWLVIDTDRNTVVVFQAGVQDDSATSRNEGQDPGPHMYYWDARDTFTVGTSRVTMEQFEEIVGGGTKANKVTVTSIAWDDYDYYVYNDRANWTVQASCAQGASQ